MRALASVLSVLVSLCVPLSAHSTTWYVIQDGSGDATAIQAGIDLAAVGDTVLVAAGTYTGAGNKGLDFGGKDIVLRSEEGPEVTVIDCEGSGRGLYFHSGESPSAVVEGFTVTNGRVEDSGGGIYCEDSSPTLNTCTFLGNSITDGEVYLFGYGAGVYCKNSSPTLTGCAFSGNSIASTYQDMQGYGGGMYCRNSCPTLTNCIFSDNSITGAYEREIIAYGGGMCCDNSPPTLTGCTFSGNSISADTGTLRETDGGGIACSNGSCATIIGCTFTQNSAPDVGGGVFVDNGCSSTISNCTFAGNSSFHGGGMYVWSYNASAALTNCTFTQNSGGWGGGIYCVGPSVVLTNCTFLANSAGRGAGMWCYQSSPILQNTIIAFSTHGEAVYCWGSECSPVLDCCNLYGNPGGDWLGCIAGQNGVNGNISADPLFCDAENGDCRLKEGSPCTPDNSPAGCGLVGAFPVGCYASISGTKFDDVNGNGTRDTWEPGLSKWMISLDPEGLATLTDDNGDYVFNDLEANTYIVTEVLKQNWIQTCPPPPGSYVVELNPNQVVTEKDFGNSKFRDYRDLCVYVGGGRARAGFQKMYGISYQNMGTLKVNGNLTLMLPPEVSHVESSDGGTYSAQDHMVTWDTGLLDPGFVGWHWTKVEIPPALRLGTVLTSIARIMPVSNDVNPANNTDSEFQVVTGSYDPNDKQVMPEGWITVTDTLRYQINFQNVGTDTAFNVAVRDTLDANLDITTLQSGASLHPYTFQITGRELAWTFSGIDLPDSNVNEPESHGFVTFKVQPMPELPVGTEIANRAAVYFDFNPPVITNTVINTILEALPADVDVDPDALNLKSGGKYVTTYIELPEGCDPWDIDVGTVLFDGVLPAVAAPTAVADYDSDGVADRMVKFNRSGVIGLLSGSEGSRWWLEERGGDTAPLRHGEEFEVTVSGELNDGTPFLGTDVLRVINPGRDADGAIVIEVYPSLLKTTAGISFVLPAKGPVSVCVYDAAGRLVRTLIEDEKAGGRHELTWDLRTNDGIGVSAGVYFIRLEHRGITKIEKTIVVK
jgi:uncharacterized repeat protein (TIGR01451 family)